MKYDDYVKKISNLKIEELTTEKIESLFLQLLSLLPNNGKLYKYRSFHNELIDCYLKALKEKYLWIPSASTMYDLNDSNLNIKLEEDVDELEQYVKENPYLFFMALLKAPKEPIEFNSNLDNSKFEDFVKYIDVETGELKTNQLVAAYAKYGMKPKEALEQIEKIKVKIRDSLNGSKEALEKFVDDILVLPQKQRENVNIFSMCERYNNNFLWDIYSDRNGFCIEYDFNKAINLSIEQKRNLLLTLKVNYYDNLKRFSIFSILKGIINESIDKEFMDGLSILVLEQVLSKDRSYTTEEEWRIIQYKTEHKMSIDLVSSIIIDERGLNEEKAKELLDIMEINGYNLIVRRFDRFSNEYVYKKVHNKIGEQEYA